MAVVERLPLGEVQLHKVGISRLGGGGGDRDPILPPPVPFCPFVSGLLSFIVFLPLKIRSPG